VIKETAIKDEFFYCSPLSVIENVDVDSTNWTRWNRVRKCEDIVKSFLSDVELI
jgi:hypothetical protein